jgi:hypothetical protein
MSAERHAASRRDPVRIARNAAKERELATTADATTLSVMAWDTPGHKPVDARDTSALLRLAERFVKTLDARRTTTPTATTALTALLFLAETVATHAAETDHHHLPTDRNAEATMDHVAAAVTTEEEVADAKFLTKTKTIPKSLNCIIK